MRVHLLFPAIALLLLLSAPAASDAFGESEVRLVAALATDGRIEFALQQREAGGAWSERHLPRKRFFPVVSTVDVWLVSTPVGVRATGVDEGAAVVDVRITARRVASGRTEFALQQRGAGGVWGERQLPLQRFFPVASTPGRWLVSSLLVVRLTGAATELAPGEELNLHPGAANAARVLAAARFGLTARLERAVAIESWGAVRWPDSSLGCSREGQAYATAEVPGYRLLLSYEGQTVRVHTDENGGLALIPENCLNAS